MGCSLLQYFSIVTSGIALFSFLSKLEGAVFVEVMNEHMGKAYAFSLLRCVKDYGIKVCR